MLPDILYFLVGAAAIIGTIAVLTMITPENRRSSLSKPLQMLHDFFNFKTLFLEKVLKALYILSTFSCILYGIVQFIYGLSLIFKSYAGSLWLTTALGGLLLAVIGVVVIRIVYELMMMFILLVKNTMDINKKMKSDNDKNSEAE